MPDTILINLQTLIEKPADNPKDVSFSKLIPDHIVRRSSYLAFLLSNPFGSTLERPWIYSVIH